MHFAQSSKNNKSFATPKRTFQKSGKWIEKPTQTVVLLCACGGKYIQTRKDQTMCIKCMAKQKVAVVAK